LLLKKSELEGTVQPAGGQRESRRVATPKKMGGTHEQLLTNHYLLGTGKRRKLFSGIKVLPGKPWRLIIDRKWRVCCYKRIYIRIIPFVDQEERI